MQKRLIVLISLMVVTLVGVNVTERLRQMESHEPDWSRIPYEMDGWSGRDAKFDPLYGADPSDSSILRVYDRGNNTPVILYVGFYKNVAAILDIHTPELCYPAQGWVVSSTGRAAGGSFRTQTISAKSIVAEKNGAKRVVTWWYNAGSEPFESRIRCIYGMLLMSVLTGRRDGSMVRLEAPIGTGGEAAANDSIQAFRNSLLPNLERALP